ncbi:MAG: ACP phosphodiesterase [Hymenobacteraceae bacterium]|nr:ACP phosphodiesterase [Hymenobacteraceae bacterium]MDX5394951.1 ACP phosphodiesterase [Hymenobacteraceae bacterium]MDX5510985.1 ACP phosphodiesterase [Hymenobacteraceae bacterium]
MNFLAHIFLSGSDEGLLLGNFIADSVKGKQALQYPERVQQGILLHRQIDFFTDTHPVVAKSKDRLRPQYRKYAGVIADIFYDHFLAANFDHFSEIQLKNYVNQVYRLFEQNQQWFPERVKHFLPYMIGQNWLEAYAGLKGIDRALSGLSRRTTFESGMDVAVQELEQHYDLYQQEFQLFFPELQAFVEEEKVKLLN